MIKVLFENSHGDKREIGTAETFDFAYDIVKKFCSDHSFDIPYFRVTHLDSGEIWLDVGSHSEFFYFVVGG